MGFPAVLGAGDRPCIGPLALTNLQRKKAKATWYTESSSKADPKTRVLNPDNHITKAVRLLTMDGPPPP